MLHRLPNLALILIVSVPLAGADWQLTIDPPPMPAEATAETGTLRVDVFPVDDRSAPPVLSTSTVMPLDQQMRWQLEPGHDGPFRAHICLAIPGYAPLWERVWPKGTASFDAPTPMTDMRLVHGVVRNADGSPRAFETVWADANGTILGYCDESGSFSVAVPAEGSWRSQAVVIYARDIIGGWYRLDQETTPENPQVITPKPAHQLTIRARDEYGQPLVGVQIRGSGGGGSKTDARGIAEIGSLYRDGHTELLCRPGSFTPLHRKAIIEADDHLEDPLPVPVFFVMGARWHYTPQAGDLLLQERMAEDGTTSPWIGIVVAVEDPAREEHWTPVVVDAGAGPDLRRTHELDAVVDRAPDRRFDVYRLRDDAHAKRFADWARIYTLAALDGDSPTATGTDHQARWLRWALEQAEADTMLSGSEHWRWQWDGYFAETPDYPIPPIAPFRPDSISTTALTPADLHDASRFERVINLQSGKPLDSGGPSF